MASRFNSILLALLTVASSATLFFFGTGLHPLWFLTWVAPLPVYLLAPRVSTGRAFLVAFLAAAIGGLNAWSYDRIVTPLAVSVIILVLPSILVACVTLLFRRFALRGQLLRAAFSVPVVTVAFIFLNQITSPHSTWGDAAYTQMNFLPILQIASITGIAGIGFLLQLLPASIAAIFAPAAVRRSRQTLATVTAAIFILTLGYGWYRLHTGRSAPTVKVALIVSDQASTLFPKGSATVALARSYAGQIPSLAAQGAEVVILPEKIGRIQGDDLLAADTLFETAARENHVTVLVGYEHQPNLNEARLYSPLGTIEARYEKHHMLPAFESHLLPGTERVVVQRPSGKWGIEICKDMDFPLLSRQYALDGAGLMLVPAWDFVRDGWLHGRMAILRGIESGFSIARAPKQGILTLTDDRGRVLAERVSGNPSPDAAPFAIVVGSIPVLNEPTFYARTGDWFAWIDLVVAFLIFVPFRRNTVPPLRR